jgi:serine/threonine protein kinase
MYLLKHREARKLRDILLQVLTGLGELHHLGFVHRDLKPENIVLNIGPPLKVALIDFDRALPATNKGKTGPRGTPGYEPDDFKFEDGDPQWDLYALVAIIAECDMGIEAYMKARNEREGKSLIKKHLETKDPCKNLVSLV